MEVCIRHYTTINYLFTIGNIFYRTILFFRFQEPAVNRDTTTRDIDVVVDKSAIEELTVKYPGFSYDAEV